MECTNSYYVRLASIAYYLELLRYNLRAFNGNQTLFVVVIYFEIIDVHCIEEAKF